MLKIVHATDFIPEQKFSDLRPGDVFIIVEDPKRIPHLKLKNVETFGNSIPSAVPLCEPWVSTALLPDTNVRLLESELHVRCADFYQRRG